MKREPSSVCAHHELKRPSTGATDDEPIDERAKGRPPLPQAGRALREAHRALPWQDYLFMSDHFGICVELPLKAIVRGFSYRIVPIKWRGRTEGTSKLRCSLITLAIKWVCTLWAACDDGSAADWAGAHRGSTEG